MALYAGLAFGPFVGEYLLRAGSFDTVWIAAGVSALVAAVLGWWTPHRVASEPQPFRLLHPSAIRPGLILFLGLLPFIGFSAFVSLYGPSIDIDDVAPLFLVYGILVLAIRIVGARLPDQLGSRRASSVALGIVGGGGLILGAWASAVGVWMATVALALGMSLLFPALFAATVAEAPEAERSQAVGTFSLFFDAASGVAPPLLGVVVALVPYRFAFALAGVIALCGIALVQRQHAAGDTADMRGATRTLRAVRRCSPVRPRVAVVDGEFAVDAAQVRLERVHRDVERAGDLAVGQPAGQVGQDPELPDGQRLDELVVRRRSTIRVGHRAEHRAEVPQRPQRCGGPQQAQRARRIGERPEQRLGLGQRGGLGDLVAGRAGVALGEQHERGADATLDGGPDVVHRRGPRLERATSAGDVPRGQRSVDAGGVRRVRTAAQQLDRFLDRVAAQQQLDMQVQLRRCGDGMQRARCSGRAEAPEGCFDALRSRLSTGCGAASSTWWFVGRRHRSVPVVAATRYRSASSISSRSRCTTVSANRAGIAEM